MPAADFRVRWAPRAKQDLRNIWRYYNRVASAEIADALLRRINAAAGRAASRPLLYRPRDGLSPGLRGVIVHPYTLFYRALDEKVVEVVRVLHERRDLESIFRRMSEADK